jgi:anti-anti-sigma factor
MQDRQVTNQITIFEPQGYITAANAHEFQAELMNALKAQDDTFFLVDMERVEFLDSAGLMVLVAGYRFAQSQGRRFSLCSIAPSVRIIFELTQLDRVFEIYKNREMVNFTRTYELAA